jgi:hypothetical protein
VWDVDIRRFAPFTSNRRALAERTVETLGLHYAMRWPRQELQTARPLRTSPLYDTLAAKGAVFGSKNGWERVNYFKPVDAPAARDTLGTPDWLPWVQAEQAATREAVALYDQTSFGKLLLQGRIAAAVVAVQMGVEQPLRAACAEGGLHQRHGLRLMADIAGVDGRALRAMGEHQIGRKPAALDHL